MLERITGPACPHCGSEDSEVVGNPRPGWGGVSGEMHERRWCRDCGRRFFRAAPPAVAPVVYVRVRCPHSGCGSTRTRVTSTRGSLRYHQCDLCGGRFKSCEPPG